MTAARTVIGFIERISIEGRNGKKKRPMARIDTGATKSSIDESLAKELDLGPVVRNKVFRSAHGKRERPIIKVTFHMQKIKVTCDFSVIDRSHMKYRVLIGQNALKKGRFMIDPLQ